MKLMVAIAGMPVGTFEADHERDVCVFRYFPEWLANKSNFALSPALPLDPPDTISLTQHSVAVRRFFQNLLPEGQALEDAAAASGISKNNVLRLIQILGNEPAGAIRIYAEDTKPAQAEERRLVSHEELSERIRNRLTMPFTVWDRRLRLSIAGYQDKLMLMQENANWYLVEGNKLASTHIVKPEPLNTPLKGLTSNEFFCMRLARAAGIHVAAVDLRHIPEPVLLIERFDRMPYRNDAGIIQQVERRHTIDGCQALGLSVESKYERLHGHEEAVKHIREGASNKLFFELVGNSKHVASPAATTLAYLRWLIFQVLIGNGDAHAKNVTFFCGPGGLSLAPAYDLVCTLAYASDIESSLAMAIGDQFDMTRIKPYDWAQLAAESALPPRLLATQISKLASLCLDELAAVTEEAEAANADMDSVRAVSAIIRTQCEFALSVAPDILRVDKTLF